MSADPAKSEITLPSPKEWADQHRRSRKKIFREFRQSAGRGSCLLRIKNTLESGLWEFPVTLRCANIETYHSRSAVNQYFKSLLRALTSDLNTAGWRVTNSGISAERCRDGLVRYKFDISLAPEAMVTFYDEDFESDTDSDE